MIIIFMLVLYCLTSNFFSSQACVHKESAVYDSGLKCCMTSDGKQCCSEDSVCCNRASDCCIQTTLVNQASNDIGEKQYFTTLFKSAAGGAKKNDLKEIKPKTMERGLGSIKSNDLTPTSTNLTHHGSTQTQDIFCPGGKYSCPETYTCCLLAVDTYGCCVYTDAVCCSDFNYCCPQDTECDVITKSCIPLKGA